MLTSSVEEAEGNVLIVVFGLVGAASVAWLYLFYAATKPHIMMHQTWTLVHIATVLTMWAIMMIAMMLPVGTRAAICAVRRANRATEGPGELSTGFVFAAAYLSIWIGFSVAATLMQWGLDSAGLLTGDMAMHSRVAASLLGISMGLYQFSSQKHDALRRCRSSDELRVDNIGRSVASVWKLGVAHGVSCLRCCWALMLLPFIGGLMNPLWMGAAMVLALAERIFPRGDLAAWLSGAGLIAMGGYVLTTIVVT